MFHQCRRQSFFWGATNDFVLCMCRRRQRRDSGNLRNCWTNTQSSFKRSAARPVQKTSSKGNGTISEILSVPQPSPLSDLPISPTSLHPGPANNCPIQPLLFSLVARSHQCLPVFPPTLSEFCQLPSRHLLCDQLHKF